MVLSYSYCNVARMPLRSEPTHRAEMVNEVLFGERAEVLEISNNDWARIRCEWDGYEGWCKVGQLAFLSRRDYRKMPKYIVARHGDRLVFEEGELSLPLGSELYGLKGARLFLLNQIVKFKGKKKTIKDLTIDGDKLKAAAFQYLHTPYLWGGRTVAGIDCSGLTQMAFKQCGVAIPRDASQQANEGEAIDFLQHAHCGDLAFFDNEEGKITHVGILLDSQTIIHATDTSGRVVVDRIDQGGIISILLKRRTHNLRMVKRYF
jgi:hypothetical protein